MILIGGIFSTLLMNLAITIGGDKTRTFISYCSNIEMINYLLLYTILFSLMSGYIFSREFSDKTSSITYTYPMSRNKIFIAKIIIIYTLIFLVYLIEVVSIYLGYYIINHTLPESTFIINHIKHNIGSLFFQFLLMPIPILIANVSRNIMLPVVYGVVGEIIMNTIGDEHFPLLAPYYFIEKVYKPNLIDLHYSVIGGILCFIISVPICIYHYNKHDIG